MKGNWARKSVYFCLENDRMNMRNRNESINYRYPTVLTIAGSDSGGGAGMQADLKTFAALGVYGASAITAITAQNSLGVTGVQRIDPNMVRQQIEAVCSDLQVDAVKIGMLVDTSIVEVVAETLQRLHPRWIILDPVLISTSGRRLLEESAVRRMQEQLFPLVDLVTPNVDELAALTNRTLATPDDLLAAGRQLLEDGCRGLLIKGGHWAAAESCDRLLLPDQEPLTYSTPTVQTRNNHGTGCTLSSAIAACLALGDTLPQAVQRAKNYITQALAAGATIWAGSGHGAMNHLFHPEPLHTIPYHV